jgi:predicted CoA-binding protein
VTDDGNDDITLRRILQTTRRIAVIGASPNPDRHSYRVMQYMQQKGYRMLPVNPVAGVGEILGEPVYTSLADVPAPIDMANVFRKPAAIADTTDDILGVAREKKLHCAWFQLGLSDDDSATRLREAGLQVVMDRCLKIEFGRLLSQR